MDSIREIGTDGSRQEWMPRLGGTVSVTGPGCPATFERNDNVSIAKAME